MAVEVEDGVKEKKIYFCVEEWKKIDVVERIIYGGWIEGVFFFFLNLGLKELGVVEDGTVLLSSGRWNGSV